MPIAENEAIEITVLSGHGEPGVLALPAGTAKNPFAVGSAGEWRIAGSGVAPVHVYFAFDGRELFVVPASPQLPVLLAGMTLGLQWTRVALPCELRFAGACLVLRAVPRIDGTTTGAVSTMRDGGALRKAAERAIAAAQRVGSGRLPDAGPPMGASGASAAGSELFSTMILPNRPHLPAHVTDPRAGSARPPAATPTPARPPTPVPPPPDPRGGPAFAGAPPPAPKAGEDDAKKGYWQTASPVKKASLVMAPFALGLAYWMLQDPPPAPPPKILSNVHKTSDARMALEAGAPEPSAGTKTTAGGSAAPAVPAAVPGVVAEPGGSAHATGRAATLDAGAVAPATAPKKMPTPLGAGKRTADRQALDAVENGSFEEAAREYADLATAHADVPAYKDAARILQDKAGRGR